ncbi:zinc finger and BTB domain-containing protein 17-like isoform X3 [Homarus americanus]|uniref:zinc finger and BTB domain-containing protein 17-like isoform X3 n=1 Tax=Homarus americanus TaxID=6706 RepID=UPI001C43F389|nr:zinc finger and BTB domain-containing protein 17-like isoform X3 [Homarus americanus]
MAPSRKLVVNGSTSAHVKRARKALSIEDKLNLVCDRDRGISVTIIAQKYGIGEQTVRDIYKRKTELMHYASNFNCSLGLKFRKNIKNSSNKAPHEWQQHKINQIKAVSDVFIVDRSQHPHHQITDTSQHPHHQITDTSQHPHHQITDTSQHPHHQITDTSQHPHHQITDTSNFNQPLGWLWTHRNSYGLKTRDETQEIFCWPSPEVKFDNSQREGLAAPEDHGSSDFSHNNGDEVPVAVSPELFLAESNERESTPAPPTPTPQKPESYQLRHNNHLTIVLEALARDESFMDVTLTAQGRSLKAHKSVLSAVSPYFRGVLRDNPCQHPIIIMPRDVRFEELFSIVNYIYKGEMTVAAEDLTSLLKTAEILQVSGLAPSDSSATVNPHTESSTAGNARSSSASSSSSSSNLPSVSKTSRMVKTSTQQTTTPPARPKSRDSMINPTDFMDVDMTCVKEEVQSADEEESEEQVTKESSSQPPGGGMKGDQTLQHSLTTFSPSFDPDLEQPTASTSSSQDISPTTLPIKSDPETEINPLGTVGTEDPHPFMCPHCQEHHRDMDTMITHLRVRHPTKPSFTCGCGRVYTRQMLHQAHARMCSSLS